MTTHPFLDLAPLTAARFASIEDRVARLLSTGQDVDDAGRGAAAPGGCHQGLELLPLEGVQERSGERE